MDDLFQISETTSAKNLPKNFIKPIKLMYSLKYITHSFSIKKPLSGYPIKTNKKVFDNFTKFLQP